MGNSLKPEQLLKHQIVENMDSLPKAEHQVESEIVQNLDSPQKPEQKEQSEIIYNKGKQVQSKVGYDVGKFQKAEQQQLQSEVVKNMSKPQKVEQKLDAEVIGNAGHFLPQIKVQESSNEIQIMIPIPQTPCFKEDTKIQVISNQIMTKIYEQEDMLKQQRQFQIMLQKQDKQIEKAKAKYQRKIQQNVLKFIEIQTRKLNCSKVYQEQYDSTDEKDSEHKQNDEQDTEIIWGKKVSTKIVDPMENYFKYRYPKQQNPHGTEEYKNWNIYKQKIYQDQMKQINDQEQKLINIQADLKNRYQTLLQRKQQRLNSSTTYANLQLRKSKSPSNQVTPSPKKKKKDHKSSQSKIHSTLSPRKTSQKRSQQITKIDFSQTLQNQTKNSSFQKETYNLGQSPSFIFDFISNMQNSNPQHLSLKSPETDFFAKQIFYYQNYSSKRSSSFVYSRDEIERLSMEGNQYPSKRKNYERPIRCQKNLRNNTTYRSKSKSPKKRAKFKDGSVEIKQYQQDDVAEQSVYHKVYEKIPKKKAWMMYSEAEGKLKEVEDYYPYDGSPSQRKGNSSGYPQIIRVNDRVGSSLSKDAIEFRIGGKNNTPQQGYNFTKQGNIKDSDQQLTQERKEIYRKKQSQREYEARVLEKLKRKKIS